MEITWKSGDAYEQYMGRWSRQVAGKFLSWLSPSLGLRWLDIGCGSGALCEAIVSGFRPSRVTALDRSDTFVDDLQRRMGGRVRCLVGDALDLPVEDAAVDIAVSGLVMNYLAEPVKGLSEMKRVTKPDGIAAVYVWDYAGRMDFLNRFWDVAVSVDPTASSLHQAKRYGHVTIQALGEQFRAAGLVKIETSLIEIETAFRSFDDYWQPFLGGQGPAPTFLMSLDEPLRLEIRDRLQESLPTLADGSIVLHARALAVRGRG